MPYTIQSDTCFWMAPLTPLFLCQFALIQVPIPAYLLLDSVRKLVQVQIRDIFPALALPMRSLEQIQPSLVPLAFPDPSYEQVSQAFSSGVIAVQ